MIVEGINIQTKHQKQTRKAAAEIKHQEGPIHVSNVMYWDSKAKAPTRIGHTVENGVKKRVSKKQVKYWTSERRERSWQQD